MHAAYGSSQYPHMCHMLRQACKLSRDITRTVRYGIVPTLRRDSQNSTLKSSTARAQCALN